MERERPIDSIAAMDIEKRERKASKGKREEGRERDSQIDTKSSNREGG